MVSPAVTQTLASRRRIEADDLNRPLERRALKSSEDPS
jgi:hypothetical protein